MVHDALLNTGVKARYLFHILYAFKHYTWFGCELLNPYFLIYFLTSIVWHVGRHTFW